MSTAVSLEKWTTSSEIPAWKYVQSVREEYGNNTKFNYKRTNWNGEIQEIKSARLFGNSRYQEVGKFYRGCRNRGEIVSNLLEITPIISTKQLLTEQEKFINDINKIIKHLQVDNLWESILIEALLCKHMGLDISKQAYNLQWGFRIYNFKTIEEVEQELQKREELAKTILDKVKSAPLHVQGYVARALENPVLFTKETYEHYTTEVDKTQLEQFIGRPIYQEIFMLFRSMEQFENPKIKKMCFHKGRWNAQDTEHILNSIAEAIDNKVNYRSPRCDNGYDVSFEYVADGRKAWYSEEYRNCGNGHYYIALNRTHAIYWEKD